jgi:methionyl-tRNA formyltransferase
MREAPRYVFFAHWSWKIPRAVYEAHECVIFHMTDVPFGRGGSPLQNLISRGIYETKLSALRCVEEMDAGPVYRET